MTFLAARSSYEKAEASATPQTTRRRSRTTFVWRLALGIVLPATGLALWEIAVRSGLMEGRLMPAPSRIAQVYWEFTAGGELWRHIVATLTRVAAGFAIGAVLGTLVGAASGVWTTVRAMIDPTIQALRAVPSIAWVPLFIVWFGILETSKVTLISLGAFFPVYLGVTGAIASVDRKLIEVGRVFRLSPMELTRRVLLPAVLPAWVVALRTGLGLGFMFVAAAELMGASAGLGVVLLDGQELSKPANILVAIITFAIVGQACDALLVATTRPLLAWQDINKRPF